ncbi:MAG: SLBB domain-containing protein, partial [Pirellulales bacterium]|nr:SLBB domain-containing protein [Pirellulales bacterium]
MDTFEPVLLEAAGVDDGHTLESYRSRGGYAPLEKLLSEKQPPEVVEMVKSSGLRGRGGAGFMTGLKWTFLPKDHPGPIYLCVNADESEPGTFNNRILMEDDPHQILEGTIISAYATRASTAYIYLRYEYPKSWDVLQKAIDEAYAAGLLGENIKGSGFSLDIYLHRGAAAYICGEETGLIESLEGKRAWPRIKPPFPAIEGAFRKPTVVNNIETMACVAQIARRGVDWFRSIGIPADPDNPRDPGSYGPKLYCLSGHVEKPGCYEAPLGITARELIDHFGGGVWKGRRAKAVIPGGISMGIMTEDELDTP